LKNSWGLDGIDATCKDGSDLYRPIGKGEEPGRQASQKQVWKTWPLPEEDYNRDYKGTEEGANYTKENTTGLWMIPESEPFKVPSITKEDFEKGPRAGDWNSRIQKFERKKEFADFYSSDNYVKDETTNLLMAPITEETCEANNGFVCKVRLDPGDVTSMIIMMMMIGMMI
jgi:hypothetical protein